MKYHHALILGDTRFLGSHLVTAIANTCACQMTVVAADFEEAAHLKQFPQVSIFVGDIDQPDVLDVAIRNVDVVINLSDTWYSARPKHGKLYGAEFEACHVVRTRNILDMCLKYGIKRYLHLSAFGVSDPELSPYYQSKLDGEEIALGTSQVQVTIFRPTVMFGPGDNFFSDLISLQKRLMAVPLRYPESRFQPVYVENVVQAMLYALSHQESIGKVYSLAGPKAYSIEALLAKAGEIGHCARPVWQWHMTSRLMLGLRLPRHLFAQGDYIFMQFANKCIDERIAQSFASDLHFSLKRIEEIMPEHSANTEQKAK